MTEGATPARLGQYEIVRRLTYGGMAEVLLGKLSGADGFQKSVVVKRVLPQHASNSDFLRMFRDEARITARLHHGNIVQVIEFGEADGQYYLVLEYVDGPSLATALAALWRAGERLSIGEVAHIGTEVARALDYAHRKLDDDGQPLQIVHRDVSPPNILLSWEGEVKLADFGIARARQRLSPTQAGIVKGKFAYMAPETIQTGRVDARSDLFALGAVLFEALSSTPAFRAENEAQTIHHLLTYEVPPPSSLNGEVPPAFDEIVLRLLSRDPDGRPARGLEVVEALAPLYMGASPPPGEALERTLARVVRGRGEADAESSLTRRLASSTTRPRVLVVDESRTLRGLLRATLGGRWVVIEASSAEEATTLMRGGPPTVVVCQRNLRGAVSGLDLCRGMRATPALQGVPFVLLSADVTTEVRREAEAAGAQAVVAKSFDPELLEATLRTVVGPFGIPG